MNNYNTLKAILKNYMKQIIKGKKKNFELLGIQNH